MESSSNGSRPQQIQDRSLSTTVSLLVLCPNMELLAVALDKNSLAIFRTSWQRLATIVVSTKADEVITSIKWSPTGAYLAVATSSGSLLIHSVDRAASATASKTRRALRDTDPVAQRLLPSPASVVVWTEGPPRQTCYEDRATLLFDPTQAFDDAKPEMVVERGFLFIADHDGMLTVLTTNLAFIIARIRVVPLNFAIHHLHVTNSLSHCVVLGHRGNANTDGSASAENCVMRLVHIDFLLEFSSEIERVKQEVVALKAHFTRFENALKQIEDSWVDGIRSVLTSSVVNPLQEALDDYSETAEVWDLLYNTFCGMRQKGALLHFLGTDVGENGAKEILRSFALHNEDTELNMFKMVTVAENVLSRASEYRGLSRLTSRFSPIGVCFDDANHVFEAADKLMGSLLEFSRNQDDTSQETTAFLIWLINAAMKASGEYQQTRSLNSAHSMHARRTELAGNFLCKMNRIKNPGSSEGLDPVVGEGLDPVVVRFTTNLQPILKRWLDCCDQVIARPCEVISKALPVSGGVSFLVGVVRSPAVVKCSVYDTTCMEDDQGERSVMAFLPMCNGGMLCIRHVFSSGWWSFAQRSLQADGLLIDDVVMASEKSVMLVSSDRRDMNPDDGKVHCRIGIYDLAIPHLWGDCDMIKEGSDGETACVRLGDSAPICKSTCGWSFTGYNERTCEMSLCVNRETGIMSLLVAPRRIFLFRLREKREAA